jgi:hypothetical protein
VASAVLGTKDAIEKLRELASPKEQAAALRASVREPMKQVMKIALANIARISPGKRALHRTYKGRLVSAGFAARNIRLIVVMSKDKQSAWALLGVRKEAFYALQFFELGTAFIPKEPWLLPAFFSSKDRSVQGVADVLRERIEKIARKRAGGK